MRGIVLLFIIIIYLLLFIFIYYLINYKYNKL